MISALRKTFLVGLGAAAMAGWPLSQAAAATAAVTFSVTAEVVTNCSITSANPLNFGNYTGVQLDGTSTLEATCSTGTPFNVGLNAGTGTGATVTARKMKGPGAEQLNYSLSQDAARTINWGQTIGTDTKTGTGTGAAQPFVVFGRIPASQFIQSGQYSDTITVTLTF